jgi:alpha-L-fucosidase
MARGAALPATGHYDFRTPEYSSFDRITEGKWEATRGIGHSFGYNRQEGEEHYLSVEALVRFFVDIVSKNGNLLLNVGPMVDGTIPEQQVARLQGLGRWLEVNGEAVLSTRPWKRAKGRTTEGLDLRFTRKGEALYGVLLDRPQQPLVTIESLRAGEGTAVHLLGRAEALAWRQQGEHLAVTLPEDLPEAPAYALRITPPPE